ncbi:hypothetical protein MKS91_01770 [Gammaproteobacteria bacterium Comchoano-2]|uniref:Tetracyclin repressor-like C-terminal domain-containing protein n=2 Tax=Candidatus Synchoanobacter obligatus TaxID=2919597 RepID=A0ABT1L4C1_9GAMM|nr:hypothetical protein [Candidatus Synchoanobacter obligatus]MCP8352019.1 hypothetical protein [Candidatus Synchoanobacter obligatus]
MCLAGMLATDVLTLDEPIEKAVADLIETIKLGIAQIIQYGIKQKEFNPNTHPESTASALVAAIEESLILTQLFKDENTFKHVMDVILNRLL